MKHHYEDAVSPVIGVLLMLVVVIIIAAVVSAFAGGLAGDTDKTPQAAFTVEPDLDDFALLFSHEGGDPIVLGSIKVVLQSGTTKGTLTTADIGVNCVAFENQYDASSGVVSTGDAFILQGTDPGWTKGIDFGSLSLPGNNKIEWSIFDKESDKVISSGSFVLL